MTILRVLKNVCIRGFNLDKNLPIEKNDLSEIATVCQPRFTAPVRWLLMTLAVASLAVGVIAAFIPGLPTTIFVIVAAWAASLSSPRLYCWITEHKLFGPLLSHWKKGEMPRRAKWVVTVLMTLAAGFLVWSHAPLGLWPAMALVCMACVLIWLWFRPEPKD